MKTNKTTTAAGRKAATQTKEAATFIPGQSTSTFTKAARIVNKVKTFLKPFVQKYRSAAVVAIALLAAIIGKLLGCFDCNSLPGLITTQGYFLVLL